MNEQLKILLLEDLEDDVFLIKRVLEKENLKFTLHNVDKREEFIRSLKDFAPDVVLSDHSLPQFNSIEALEICQQLHYDIPFILVTGTVSEEFAVLALKQGADDYVLKSNLGRLPASIINAIKNREGVRKRIEAEMRLRKQNEELVKINKELDSFVYNVSHNLRAPLLSVKGLINLAKIETQTKEFENIEDYFFKIEHSVDKLDETLKEILDYSRNSRSTLSVDIVDFQVLINDVLDKLKYLRNSEELNISIQVENSTQFANDKYRIGVILSNLISNALKYLDPLKNKKEINIDVNVNPDKAVIRIADNGIGIDEVMLDKIFDMFFRATEKSQGSGLGLYIVKEDVEKLGGSINVQSKKRVGTTFEFTIPNLYGFTDHPGNKDELDSSE